MHPLTDGFINTAVSLSWQPNSHLAVGSLPGLPLPWNEEENRKNKSKKVLGWDRQITHQLLFCSNRLNFGEFNSLIQIFECWFRYEETKPGNNTYRKHLSASLSWLSFTPSASRPALHPHKLYSAPSAKPWVWQRQEGMGSHRQYLTLLLLLILLPCSRYMN